MDIAARGERASERRIIWSINSPIQRTTFRIREWTKRAEIKYEEKKADKRAIVRTTRIPQQIAFIQTTR